MRRVLRKKLEQKLATSIAWQTRGRESLCSFHTTGPMGLPPWFVYVKRAKGARIWDVDDNEYVDLSAAYGPCLFGHAPDFVLEAIQEAANTSLVHGLGNTYEIELAERICAMVPSVQAVQTIP